MPAAIYSDGHSLVAGAIVLILTGVICLDINVSAKVNAVIVTIKLAIVMLVIIAGLFYVKASDYSPFVPPAGSAGAKAPKPSPSLLNDIGLPRRTVRRRGHLHRGCAGLLRPHQLRHRGTAAEETKKPQRDMPREILSSLAVGTTLYVAVSLVITGMVHYDKISVDAPLAEAFRSVHPGMIATIMSVGALAGLTTVMMILMIGQSRAFFAMARDGLLPPVFAQVDERTGTAVRTTMTTGIIISLLTTLLLLQEWAKLVNIGTLFAFIVVAIGVVNLRRTRPDLERPFRTPLVPLLPFVSVFASFYLMLNLTSATWLRFAVWMVIGLAVYASYGYRRSRLRRT